MASGGVIIYAVLSSVINTRVNVKCNRHSAHGGTQPAIYWQGEGFDSRQL